MSNDEPTQEEIEQVAAEDMLRDVLYDRSHGLYDIDKVDTVHVVGTGGIGTWVAMSLAMAGCRDIHIYDEDELELHNLNRLPFTKDDLGKQKTQAISDLIQTLRPDCKVTQHGFVVDEDSIELEDGDRVVICVDSANANNTIMDAVSDRIPEEQVIRAGYDGDRISVITAAEQWDDGPPGYGIDPSYVVPPMVAAGLVVERLYREDGLEVHSKHIRELGVDDE